MNRAAARAPRNSGEMEIARRETRLGDVVERHGVARVDGEHRVEAELRGGRHGGREIREQARVELQGVLGDAEVRHLVVAHEVREREGVVAAADGDRRSICKHYLQFSDMIGGAALTSDPELVRQMRKKRSLFGNILQPDECWMLDGRLPTVNLRMNRSSKNAERIANRLAKNSKVERVLYPTLFTDPEQVRISKEQCDFPGGMLSLDLKGGKKAAFEFLRNLQIARNAVSLGSVETLVCHPKSTTHSGFTEEEFAQAGVTDGLVRISIGIEDWRDLLSDFEQALDCI